MRLLGEGVERKKPNAAVTVSWRDTEWDRPPPVTLIETVTVPVGTDSVAVKETLTVQVGLHGLFVKYAVTPSGRSEAVMVTGTAEPVVRVAVIEDEGLVSPRTKEIEPGDGEERLNSKLGCSTAEITLTVPEQ